MTLGCSASKVTQAIQHLIANGKRNAQRDGIVYSRTGAVLRVNREGAVPSSPDADPGTGSDGE